MHLNLPLTFINEFIWINQPTQLLCSLNQIIIVANPIQRKHQSQASTIYTSLFSKPSSSIFYPFPPLSIEGIKILYNERYPRR